jgi:hypothetical protein
MTVKWTGDVAEMGDMRNTYRILVGNRKGRLVGRPRRRWEDNIRMDHKEIVCEVVDLMGLAQDTDH